MTYSLSAEQVSSVTDVELAFGTARLLPAWDEIPKDFKKGNCYTAIAEAILYGRPLPEGDLELADDISPADLNKCIRAHLASFDPSHEHKLAGVGYLMSFACTFTPDAEAA